MHTGVMGNYQLMTIGNLQVGRPLKCSYRRNSFCYFCVTSGLEPNAAVAAAIPFALLGQYGVTIIFSLMSPVMAKADQYAKDADPKGIEKINYFVMILLGSIFGIIVVLFFIAGSSFGASLAAMIPETLMHLGCWWNDEICRFCSFI